MKKQFLNLGKALSKAEQKEIFGGVILAECTAQCLSLEGNSYYVSCSGSYCNAADYVGCASENNVITC